MDEPNWPQEIASTPVVHFNLLDSAHIPTHPYSTHTRCRHKIATITIRFGVIRLRNKRPCSTPCQSTEEREKKHTIEL